MIAALVIVVAWLVLVGFAFCLARMAGRPAPHPEWPARGADVLQFPVSRVYARTALSRMDDDA